MYDPELDHIAGTLHDSPFPEKFAVEISADCNLACTMCHHPDMRRPKGKMPFELWERCADQIAAISPDTQCWFSFCGEPLMEPGRLLRFVAYGRSVGLRSMNLNTNGMLLRPELAGPILESGLSLIVCGIDGFSRETYERIRVDGIRDELYANIEYLLAERDRRGSNVQIQVQFIEMDENEHEIDAFCDYWLKRGATVKLRNKLSWGGRFGTPMEISADDRIPCPWAITMMHVFWDGRIPRCPGDTEGDESVGNAWDEPLEVLWERLGIYRRMHLERRFAELPDRCQICKDWMTGAAVRIRPNERVS